ncbi:MAG: DNRLRE domain-containing protein [Chloroflexi bacterium]|nr:DNRLRE domain-containing protein [Chloroflexota bacterium]
MKTKTQIRRQLTIFLPLLSLVLGAFLALHPTLAETPRPEGLPTPWHARLPSAPYPGIWYFTDLDVHAPNYPHVVGSHRTWAWETLEPAPGVYRWDLLERWINAAVAGGRPVALGVNTYDGIYDGGDLTPRWVYEMYPAAELVCPDGWTIPRYWDENWQRAWENFIAAFAARYDGDPRIAWVEISTGVYGETRPVSSEWHRKNCLIPAGLTSSLWVETVNAITDIYVRHFHRTTLFLQMAPAFEHWWERREFTRHAAALGVGLKHNGLQAETGTAVFGPCPTAGSQCESGVVELMREWGDRVPIAWEGDPRYLRPRPQGAPADDWIPANHPDWAVYWQILNALDKHSDYILYNRWLAEHPANQPLFQWADRYLGRTVYDAPSAWVALRDTVLSPYQHPQRGNFTFFLEQRDDVPGGRSVPVWDVGPKPQGYYARRTDESTGNRYFYFDVDDRFLYDGNARDVRVRVTYLDWGHDTWALEYDGVDGPFTLAGVVQKTHSGEWRTEEFFLPDARFANRQPGHTDFRLDSRNDGDEIVHFVEVVRAPLTPPTPTPTPVRPPYHTPTPTPGPPVHEIRLQEGREGYTGVTDTYISRTYATVNYGDQPILSICPACPRMSQETRHILIRFPLDGVLPPRAEVKYAWVALYAAQGGGALYGRGYRLLRPWTEQGATWLQPMPGQEWGEGGALRAGVDREGNWLDQGTVQDVGRWIRIDVTQAVRAWLRRPDENFGLLIVPFNLGGVEYGLASSEYGDPGKRPQLRVGYILPDEPTPTPSPTWTPEPTPTPTPDPTPSVVYWTVAGRLYDAERDTPIVSGTITLTLGTDPYRWVVHSDAEGRFSLIAPAPDQGRLHYQASARGYYPAEGSLPARRPRQYMVPIPLRPRVHRYYVPYQVYGR